jgi:transketolase
MLQATPPLEPAASSNLEELSVNTIRLLSADMVQKANSGHLGLPLGAAPMAYVLWTRFLRFNPQDPHWPNRDLFILSAGHSSALLYSLLHLTGYDQPLGKVQRFRQTDSKTPGHPEIFLTPGVEVTTGPLGQGFGNGVGVVVGIDRFGESGPGEEVMQTFGFTVENVSNQARTLLHRATP